MEWQIPRGREFGRRHSRSATQSRRLRFTTACTALLFLLPFAFAGAAVAASQSITAPKTVTMTVPNHSFDKFAVTPPSGQGISVRVTVTSGGNIDVLIPDPANEAKYEDPAVMTWSIKDSQFNTTSWSGTVSGGGLMYLVIENDDTTTGGASPSGPVTYAAEFTQYSASLGTIIAAVVLIGGLAALFGARVALRRRAQRRTQAAAGAIAPGAGQVYGAPTAGYPQAQAPMAYAQYPQQPSPYAPSPPYQPPPPPPYPPRP
jgi:hypothetical protein